MATVTDANPNAAPGPGDLGPTSPPDDAPYVICGDCRVEYQLSDDGETERCPECVADAALDHDEALELIRELRDDVDQARMQLHRSRRETDRLEREVDRLAYLEATPSGIARRIVVGALAAERTRDLQADRDGWKAATRRWAGHDQGCRWWTDDLQRCDCGLTAVLAGKEQPHG